MDIPISTEPLAAPHARSSTDVISRATFTLLALCAALCITLTGCASGSKHATIPSDGPTMADIYRQHMTGLDQDARQDQSGSGAGRESRLRLGPADPPDTGAFQRTVANEIDNRFPRLPNPDLVMFVTPHLSANGRYPVPGYSTVFPMYETVEYAMPGEVPWRHTPDAPAAGIKANASLVPLPIRSAVPDKLER